MLPAESTIAYLRLVWPPQTKLTQQIKRNPLPIDYYGFFLWSSVIPALAQAREKAKLFEIIAFSRAGLTRVSEKSLPRTSSGVPDRSAKPTLRWDEGPAVVDPIKA